MRKGITIESTMQSVCPVVWMGAPHPFPRKWVLLPPEPKWGEQACGGGGGGPNLDDWKDTLVQLYMYTCIVIP